MTRSLVADSCASPPPPKLTAAAHAMPAASPAGGNAGGGAPGAKADSSYGSPATQEGTSNRGWFRWLWGGRVHAAVPLPVHEEPGSSNPPSLADLQAEADALAAAAAAKGQDPAATQSQAPIIAQQQAKGERRVHIDGASGQVVDEDGLEVPHSGLEPAGPEDAAARIPPAPSAASAKARVPPYVRSAGVAMDIQHPLELALLNVFVEALFDIRPDGFPGQKVADAMNQVLQEANERLKLPLSKLWKRLSQPKHQADVRKSQVTLGQVYGYLYDVIRSRGEPRASETDLWACLARVRDSKTGSLLSKSQLLPEIGAMMMAGFDTSSHTVAWCLYALASNPEVQAKMHAELAEHGLLHGPGLSPRSLQYEDLPRLPYLCAVVDETMRMFPVAATASVREITTPTRVGGYLLPPGVIVWPMLYAMHNAAHNWKDPHIFRPERWLGASKSGPGGGSKAFVPFSDGMKSCLGQALGLMEVRACLATMLSRCWLELDPARPPGSISSSMVMSLTLKMKHGLALLAHPHDPAWSAKCAAMCDRQGGCDEFGTGASGSATTANSTVHSRSSSVSGAMNTAA